MHLPVSRRIVSYPLLRALYNLDMNENMTTSDVALCYECHGSGPDLLLVHGFASSLRVWDPLVAALQDAFRCWAVDLAGCGATRIPPDRSVTLDEHVAHLRAFVRQHGIRPRAVIGHSMGGMLTLKLALAEPELAERLVLVAPAVTGQLILGVNRVVAAPPVRWLLKWTQPAWDVLQSETLKPLLVTPPYLAPDVRARVRDDFRRMSWAAAMSAMTGISKENLAPHLPQITQPTLVVVGTRDDMVPPSEGRLAAQRLPNGRLLEVSRAHHLPLDEAPQQTIPAIRDFLLAD